MPIVYTSNDEVGSPQLFAVEVGTGKTIGTADISPGLPGDGDPEALTLDVKNGGILYLADIGDGDETDDNNQPSRTNCAVYGLPEFGPGAHGTLPCKKYPISYPGGVKHNSEAFAINPVSGLAYICTKGVDHSILYRLNRPFSTGGNVLEGITSAMPALVTDMCFTINGQWLLVRSKKTPNVLVFDHLNWKQAGTITCPKQAKGESITCEPNGKSFLIGSEGDDSPLYRVILPTKFRGNSTTPPSSSPTQPAVSKPGQLFNTRVWKLTLPTGKQGDPDEILSSALLTYEHPKYFFDSNGRVVFTTPYGGVTTGTSVNPRTELREMKTNGANAAWNSAHGNHRLTLTKWSFNHVGDVKKQATIAQVHDSGPNLDGKNSDDRVMIRYEGTSDTAGDVWCDFGNGKGTSPTSTKILSGYTLGQVVPKLAINCNSAGFRVFINDVQVASRNITMNGLYFKAGCYPQRSSDEAESDFAQTRIGGIVINHS